MTTVVEAFPQANKLYGTRKMSSSRNSLFMSGSHRKLSRNLMKSQGLFGQMNKGSPYLDVARQTSFPSWNNMIGTKLSEHTSPSEQFEENERCIIETKSVQPKEPAKEVERGTVDLDLKANLVETDGNTDFRVNLDTDTNIFLSQYQKPSPKFSNRRCSEPVLNVHKNTKHLELSHPNTPNGSKRNGIISSDRNTKVHNPSHYKGKRRGTYAAVYDPVITARKPKIQNRSKSLFTHADDIACKDLNTCFLKSLQNLQIAENDVTSPSDGFLAQNNTTSLENVSLITEDKRINEIRKVSLTKSNSFTHRSCDDTLIDKKRKKKEKQFLKKVPNFLFKTNTSEEFRYLSEDSSGHSAASSPDECYRNRNVESCQDNNNNTIHTIEPQAKKAIQRTYRALSTVDISQRHLRNLERKYEKARKRALWNESRFFIDSSSSDTCTDSSSDLSANEETTDVHDAVKIGDVKKLKNLINKGYNINSLDKKGKPPCHYALQNAQFDCLAVLITSGADLHEYFQTRRIKYFR